VVVPIHVAPRLVRFQIDKDALDEAFDPDIEDVQHKSADEVIDNIASRLKKRLGIDTLVSQITEGDKDWVNAQKVDRAVRRGVRSTLKKYELHNVQGLFEKAYEYIEAHY